MYFHDILLDSPETFSIICFEPKTLQSAYWWYFVWQLVCMSDFTLSKISMGLDNTALCA